MTNASLKLRRERSSIRLIAAHALCVLAADWLLILGAVLGAAGAWVVVRGTPWGQWLVPLTATLLLGGSAAFMRWVRRAPLSLHWGRWLGLALLLSACQWLLTILSALDERFAAYLVIG